MFKYKKGVTITKEELEVLRGSIESAIHNRLLFGCKAETYDTLKALKSRLQEAKEVN